MHMHMYAATPFGYWALLRYSKGWPITTAAGPWNVPTNPSGGGGGGGGGGLASALLAPWPGWCWPCGASTTTAYAVCTGGVRALKTCARGGSLSYG